jgi:hypothetical protein
MASKSLRPVTETAARGGKPEGRTVHNQAAANEVARPLTISSVHSREFQASRTRRSRLLTDTRTAIANTQSSGKTSAKAQAISFDHHAMADGTGLGRLGGGSDEIRATSPAVTTIRVSSCDPGSGIGRPTVEDKLSGNVSD